MAQVQRHRRAIATALFGLLALAFAPAFAEDQGPNAGTDLYDRPVLAIDPGMHAAAIRSQAVDAAGRFAVTGGNDRTVRIWSAADGKLLRTIWMPVGFENVGVVWAVAISPDGSMIAAGGWTERIDGDHPVYIFDRESGNLIRRIGGDLPDGTDFLTFSPDGRYLAATLDGGKGLRVFDRDKDWHEVFRDDQYGAESLGASFAHDGRLVTTSWDGLIRLYQFDLINEGPNFRRVGEPVEALSGSRPSRIAFSPDGKRLALGYWGEVVDILDGTTLERVGGHSPKNVHIDIVGLYHVAWSRDGQTLFADGAVVDAQDRTLLFAWDRNGLGDEHRMTYCAPNTATGVDALPDGRILAGSMGDCLGLMDAHGEPIWTVFSPLLDLSGRAFEMRVSSDGKVVDFGYFAPGTPLRFDVSSLTLSSPPPNDGLTFRPIREGLTIDGWRSENNPTLNYRALPVKPDEMMRSLAIAPDAKRFFLGSNVALRAFDDSGAKIWSYLGQGEVWAVNASKDGRIVVAAHSDGTIRWHRADDGRELLALQVLPNKESDPAKWDWVLWTPQGYYEATPGAQDVLKWVVNHGPDHAATTLPVSAIPRFHRPDALPLVLQELETARALGIAELTAGRLAVQKATGSAKPPGGTLHVLAIGVDKFGDKAGDLHLDYAAEDAHDIATALEESQTGKASLYADVKIQYLPNDRADNTAIRDALDDIATSMAASGPNQDVAVILVSSHGEMIDGQFYLVPYGVDLGSKNRIIASALSAADFAKKVQAIAARGKVLLLLDACHSGAVRPGGWATDPDAKVLRDVLNMDNVTVLASSDEKGLSEELPTWRHGALAQAFLDALTGAGDSSGIIRLTGLINQMDGDLRTLTQGRQSLGQHANFGGDLFMASHY